MTSPRPRRASLAVLVCTVLGALTGSVAAGAATAPAGLPRVETGHRPGPDALYLPPPSDVPQLTNVAPWVAEPILVSGASAYRDGEFLYQDFLFDDHGATGIPSPSSNDDPYGTSTNLYSPTAGTFLYPHAPDTYAYNAADLVEFRVKPLADATAIRVTLNTLLDPSRSAVTVALGDAVGSAAWPFGAGVNSPAEVFVTWHGDQVALTDAASGDPLTPAATATFDLERRQIDLRVPHAAWDPGTDTVRMTVGVGLWDPDGGTYHAPLPGPPSATTPGGGTLEGVAIVNVGPRYDEPTPILAGFTMGDTAALGKVSAPWWRERDQSIALTQGDVSGFFAEVDFAKLAAGQDDESLVPTSGPMNRIVASRYVFGQGVAKQNVCFGISSGINVGTACVGRYVGQLQPYALYVPDVAPPASSYGLTLLLHALSANYNQYLGSNHQSQLGDRGAGSLVVTPEARGPDGFYKGIPEAHTFEVWADVARHYPVDATWVSSSGYSMGSFGTYRLMARYPDLFARGFNVVGEPGTVDNQLISLRNTPLMNWNAGADELVNLATAEAAHSGLVEAGVDHTYWLFPSADHLTLAGNDEYGPGAAFLGEHRVDRSPPTVAFVVDPREDTLDVVADHAYWLSQLTVRDPEASPTGSIQVHSSGFGTAAATASDRPESGGAVTGGQNQAMTYIERGVLRTPGGDDPIADRLTITAANVGHVSIDPVRARVTCEADLVVESDGPLEVELAGCEDVAPVPTPPPGPLPATGGGAVLGALAAFGALAASSRRRD